MVTAPARRELVRQMIGQGLSERRACCVARMSASAYRYAPRPDRNVDLRQQIVSLAQRHRRYGVGMIHLLPGAFQKTQSPAHFAQRIANLCRF